MDSRDEFIKKPARTMSGELPNLFSLSPPRGKVGRLF
jgi:hypothetical protein|tara:strand:- start:306 stop:416 length:111 start_codon:yes stop_codon:yes gene_type:complete